MRTSSKMLQNYFATGRYVVLGSVLCVLRGIVELKKEWIFAGALIKKRRYWPALVPGDAFDEHFEFKEVGNTDVVSGKLNGTDYFIWGMKEPDYVMKIMGSGGLLNSEGFKEVWWKWKDGNKLHKKICLYKAIWLAFFVLPYCWWPP